MACTRSCKTSLHAPELAFAIQSPALHTLQYVSRPNLTKLHAKLVLHQLSYTFSSALPRNYEKEK